MAYLKSLFLKDFRNYGSAHLELSPKINIFVGKNGQGKTNCLEAITLLIAGKSFRTNFLRELIRHESSHFRVEALYDSHGLEHSLKLFYSPKERKLLSNGMSYSSFAPLIGGLHGVFFSGFHNELIKGAPALRRRFLDFQCSQTSPLYLHHLKRYHQALKSRNALLRQRKEKHLGIYEELMSESAPYLVQERLDAIGAIEKLALRSQASLTNNQEPLKLEYAHSLKMESRSSKDYLASYKKERVKDLKYGQTSVGPHKDDLLFSLGGMEAKKYASEGQIQSLITSIYLAEYERILEVTGQPPLFCIDDIGQNLDPTRLKALYIALDQMGQVFITTPHLPELNFSSPCKIFEIKEGSLLSRTMHKTANRHVP